MGIRDFFSARSGRDHAASTATLSQPAEIAVAADLMNISNTFNDKNITYNGDVMDVAYDSILRDKQGHINDLYQLADYWMDADSLVRSCIREVYVPFSLVDDYRLVGGTEQTRQKYQEYFDKIKVYNKLNSIFLQFYLFANVYVCIQPDGDIITLPPHLCRIGNISINSKPIVEFNCKTIRDDLKRRYPKAYKKFIEDEDLDKRLSGFPPEVAIGLKDSKDWVQLNPATTFPLQDVKAEWSRYAIPNIAACLEALKKKYLISQWEDSMLKLSSCGFVHVKYGSSDPNAQCIVNAEALQKLQMLFGKAMSASEQVALAVTNNFCDAKFVALDNQHVFDYDKYKTPNADILSAFGISGVVVSGEDNAASFGSSQVSVKMVALRIQEAKRRVCDLMNDIIATGLNGTRNGLPRSTSSKLPKFTFPITDLSNNTAFQEKVKSLWEAGLVSYQTMLETHGFDYDTERELKARETKEKIQTEVFVKPGEAPGETDTKQSSENEGETKIGRPTMSDDERNSDPSKSETGRQAKPSNPEGSEAQE